LIVLATAFFVSKRTTASLNKLKNTLKTSASDGLIRELRVDNVDEIDDLADVYNRAGSQLNKKILALTSDRDRISTVLSQMSDGIIVVDRDNMVSTINNAALKMFHKEEWDAAGHSFMEVTMDYEINNLVKLCIGERKQFTARIVTRPGKQILGVVVTPLKDNSGCLVLLQDLTETQKSEIARRDFISNVSHELRTPVTSIKAMAETLKEGALDDKAIAADFLEKIGVEADRITGLIQGMTDLLQIESGAVTIRKTLFDAGELAYSVVGRLKAQADRSQISIVVNAQEAMPWIKADKEKIERVLVNLIHNAVKFTLPGGKITVSVTIENQKARFSVADTGIGIPGDDLPRILERFYKADKARHGGGTGLGLAISKQIVEAHEGKIWVESMEGKGSTFFFEIPQ
jgi:two-component system, OmpR family, phosphate regulon sensor histidine kinase PhoR